MKGTPAHQEVRPSQTVHAVRRTTQPSQKSNYELFNCNNFNIRYWSWNYRGCWHQTCPPMEFVKGFRLYSFQLPSSKEPGIVISCHYLPVSGLGNLRACCLPWMW